MFYTTSVLFISTAANAITALFSIISPDTLLSDLLSYRIKPYNTLTFHPKIQNTIFSPTLEAHTATMSITTTTTSSSGRAGSLTLLWRYDVGRESARDRTLRRNHPNAFSPVARRRRLCYILQFFLLLVLCPARYLSYRKVPEGILSRVGGPASGLSCARRKCEISARAEISPHILYARERVRVACAARSFFSFVRPFFTLPLLPLVVIRRRWREREDT